MTGTPDASALTEFCNDVFGDDRPLSVKPMAGGGSCEVFAVDRAGERMVLRRGPERANTSRAHDVLREYRILDAIKDRGVRIPRPIASCADPSVFGSPFFLMERVDGAPIRSSIPEAWAAAPEMHGLAVVDLLDALVEVHAVDWEQCGLGDLAHESGYLGRQIDRWLAQLTSYDGRELSAAADIADWLHGGLPAEQPQALCHGDYKLDNALFSLDLPPRLLVVVDWEMASIGDPLVDLCWMLVFHPTSEGLMPLGTATEPRLDPSSVPSVDEIVARYAQRSGRDVSAIDWYQVFSRWKMAIVLEGGYAKFQKGLSSNPYHEHFGAQADRLLLSATTMIEQHRS